MKKQKIIALLLCAVMVFSLTACDSKDYKTAMSLTESGDWKGAREIFLALEDYEDSAAMVTECDYRLAIEAMDAGQFDDAIAAFAALGEYEDAADLLTECRYGKAQAIFASGDFSAAQELFAALGDYKDCAEMVTECKYQTAVAYYDAGEFEKALNAFVVEELLDYKETDHYTVLTMLQYDQQSFVDIMAAGMNGLFIENNIPLQLTEGTAGSKKHDARYFNITEIYDTAYVNVTFAPSNGEGTITSDGQINFMDVCADSYKKSSLDMVAEQYFLASGVMMATLVDGTDIEEFAALMADQLDQTVDSSSEYVKSESSAFEYEGYNCRVSVSDFGDDIIRLVFSITVPELVG